MGREPENPELGKTLNEYVSSVGDGNALTDSLLGRLWRKAYAQAGEPEGALFGEELYNLAVLHQRALKDEMRRICSRFTSADLFFATRIWSPGVISKFGLNLGEDNPSLDPTTFTMALRRVATNAALLYGRPFPKNSWTIAGGAIPSQDVKRFARTFVALLMLSRAYYFSGSGLRTMASMGYGMFVSVDGVRSLEEERVEADILTYSNDRRKHLNYNLLFRIGEFDEHPPPIFEPYEGSGKEELGDRAALITAWYQRDARGVPGYRLHAQLLEPVERLLMELNRSAPSLAENAWGMGFEEFVALLGGFSEMLKSRFTDDQLLEEASVDVSGMAEQMFRSATLFFLDFELEGDGEGSLVEYATGYAMKKGLDLDDLDLVSARDKFLDLVTSTNKHEVEDDSGDPGGISLGDSRYSYLMHKFGLAYVVDLFHADHWLNRPLDMLSAEVRGDEGRLKGRRVENRVWAYLVGSDKIEPVEALRNAPVRSAGKNEQYNDLDCPLKVGDVLVLAEIKGKYMGRAPEAFSRPDVVERRWKENLRLLEKIDKTARLLALRRGDATFREAMQ